MRNKLFASALVCLAFTSNAFAAIHVVIEADSDYAPYSYVENGQLKGIYVEFLRKVAEKLAPTYKVSLLPMPWKRGLKNLETGDSLALIPPYRIKERAYIQPYSTPMLRETVVLFCSDAVMKSPRTVFPEDFAGLTIGVNLGFALGDRMIEAINTGKIKIEEAKGNALNIQKLAQGSIACYGNDRLSVIHTIKGMRNKPGMKDFKLIEAAELWGEDAFVGYSAANGASYKADFIAKMNVAIEEAKKAGVLNKLVAGYSK